MLKPLIEFCAPTPITAAEIPVIVFAPVAGSPIANPFTTPDGGSYGDQIVMLAPFT
jgi:hypothetical protein